jgi:hypothetical protein
MSGVTVVMNVYPKPEMLSVCVSSPNPQTTMDLPGVEAIRARSEVARPRWRNVRLAVIKTTPGIATGEKETLERKDWTEWHSV